MTLLLFSTIRRPSSYRIIMGGAVTDLQIGETLPILKIT
jgi:hypothetical protein